MHFHANFSFFFWSSALRLFLFLHLNLIYIFFVAQRIIFLCDRHQQLILQGKVFIVFHHYWIANLNLSLFFSFSCGNFFSFCASIFFHSFSFFQDCEFIFLFPLLFNHNIIYFASTLNYTAEAGNKKVLENNGIMKIFTRLFFLVL